MPLFEFDDTVSSSTTFGPDFLISFEIPMTTLTMATPKQSRNKRNLPP